MQDLKNIYRTLSSDPFPKTMTIRLGDQELLFHKRSWHIDGEDRGLRYGENPDQPAALYALAEGTLELDGIKFRDAGDGLVSAVTEEHMLQSGKHPGKINLTDVDNGINILQYLHAKPAAVILKHNNPCGAAWNEQGLETALKNAYWSDRIAAFGGTVVVNRTVDIACAAFLGESYFEVVAAPEYDPQALELLKKRKNLRILRLAGLARLEEFAGKPFLDIKSLADGGMIVQFSFTNRIRTPQDFLPAKAEKDNVLFQARTPNPREMDDLLFAWAVEAGVTSNSVLFVRDGATVAVGTGEQDRVGCVQLTIHKAYTKYADWLCFTEQGISLYELQAKAESDDQARTALDDIQSRTQLAKGGLPGSVLVSDGFFPFRDGVDLAVAQGVMAIAQPGGSIRDHEIIEAVNQAEPQVAMVFTGQRSFRH
ncbi:phosphoribosylaminoimidazolecarboxamide formyltransferase / IMP cyclohydrolase [Desulfonatronum thiosulfatophilum]|uniref:Phosphoribosylaminoimidazolecarboxamide formyltransferase / IMP cyclohydrolase n=1 Tax=Desulfonatronum thiosulfatophilum TaxID=617002 RepID=A0A1G6A1N3_9BACT|nr:IMP cyclohydrolase [Desulfonatronum thiosulfatophilum]SDB02398.1 phosphoribosylaminoimidazolecarboxamide formyltransferase / IMP cyclohydrolase [Desulfonatronum thiosulfatophilum]